MRVGNYEIGFFYARRVEERSLSLSNPALANYLGFPTSSPHQKVSNEVALTIPPVWSAIRYISEGIAGLNRGVFIRQADQDVFPDHGSPVSALIDGRPHPNYSMFDFLQALVTNACMGNGYARIHMDPITARPSALELIPQEFVDIEYSQNGAMWYRITGILNDKTVIAMVPHTEMIHIKGVSFTGIQGKKLSVVHRDSFALGKGSAKYSTTYFDKGASVGGLVTFPNPLNPEQYDRVKNNIQEKHSGAGNAGSVMVLDAGADFKAIQAGPKDAAVIDFNNLTTIQVSQIFKIPLHLLSQLDRSTFSNMEQQNQDFVVHCLRPWARKIEEEFNTKLFTTSEIRNRRRFFAFDLDAMMMGDMQAQATFFSSAIQNAWMTPNEVRVRKNMNRIEGGDVLFIQQNMAPIDLLEELLHDKNGQSQTQDAQAGQGSKDNPDDTQNDTPNASKSTTN